MWVNFFTHFTGVANFHLFRKWRRERPAAVRLVSLEVNHSHNLLWRTFVNTLCLNWHFKNKKMEQKKKSTKHKKKPTRSFKKAKPEVVNLQGSSIEFTAELSLSCRHVQTRQRGNKTFHDCKSRRPVVVYCFARPQSLGAPEQDLVARSQKFQQEQVSNVCRTYLWSLRGEGWNYILRTTRGVSPSRSWFMSWGRPPVSLQWAQDIVFPQKLTRDQHPVRSFRSWYPRYAHGQED